MALDRLHPILIALPVLRGRIYVLRFPGLTQEHGLLIFPGLPKDPVGSRAGIAPRDLHALRNRDGLDVPWLLDRLPHLDRHQIRPSRRPIFRVQNADTDNRLLTDEGSR